MPAAWSRMLQACLQAEEEKEACWQHISTLCYTSFVSLLQVLQRFLKVGGVPRDICKSCKAWNWKFDNALSRKKLLQVTRGVYGVHTSGASHELTLITVPAWRTGQHPTCLQRATGADCGCTFWQAATFTPCR